MYVSKRNLVLNGWRIGLDKVRLTRTLQSELGYTLAPAKSVTDRVLAGEVLTLPLENSYLGEEGLLKTLHDIGVDAILDGCGSEVEDLPPELAREAVQSGQEFAWPVDIFPTIAEAAPGLGYACLGGQFQFQRPSGEIFEVYWLSADPSEREAAEPWSEFTTRSCMEVARGFTTLLQSAGLQAEVEKFKRMEVPTGETSRSKLVFCAYFVSETEWRELGAR